jgi:hypothetical protein
VAAVDGIERVVLVALAVAVVRGTFREFASLRPTFREFPSLSGG